MPAPLKNQNAAKPEGEAAESFLHIRCRRQDKARWVRAANQRKMQLAAWVKDVLDSRSGN